MKIIEEIISYIDTAQQVEKAKKMLETLTINWASDPEEMQFESLKSSSVFTPACKFLRMDKIKIEDVPYFGDMGLFQGVQMSLGVH